MSAVTDQRPLDLGRALDAALLIYRRNFVAVAAAMAVAVVPLELATLAPAPWNVIANLLQLVVLAGLGYILWRTRRRPVPAPARHV